MAEVTVIRTGELTKEQAEIKAGQGTLSPWRQSVADGLTPASLGGLMRAADQGDPEAYLVLAEEIAEREPHYLSVLNTRTLGVSGSERGIAAAGDSPDEVAIADDVEQIVQRPEFESLITDLMDAVAKGFACVEIMWDRSLKRWEPTEYRFREQRYFNLDRDTYTRPQLRTVNAPTDGEPLTPFKWLVHRPKIRAGVPIRTGLARTVAVVYAGKRFAYADWMSFLDVYGIPLKIGRVPNNMKERAPELFRALQRLGTDATAVIPAEMTVELLEIKGAASGTVFREALEYLDKQTSKIVLGQTMTSDDGASLSQSKTHERVRFDIRAADARAIVATINRDLIKPFVQLNYGEQKAYPSLYLNTAEPEDTKMLMDTVKVFVDLGGKVQMSEIRDRIGVAEPEEGAELLGPKPAPATPAPGVPNDPPPDEEVPDDEGADPDDEVAQEGDTAERNARRRKGERYARDGVQDVADDVTATRLDEWRPLLEGNVGQLMREVNACSTFAEARNLVESYVAAGGEGLDTAKLLDSLARATFLARGVGDGTDDTEI